jgi:transposase
MLRHREPVDRLNQAEALNLRLANETNPANLERLHVIRLAIEGELTLSQIAKARDLALSTVQLYVRTFREGGLEALLPGPKTPRGPQSGLTQAQRDALMAGLKQGKWPHARHIHKFLDKELGVKVVRGTVYKYLAQLKGRLKVGRKSHVKKKPEKTHAFREGGLLEQLDALQIEPGRPVRIWVEDEARIGLHTNHRRVWTLRGCEVTVPTQQKYQWEYVYGLFEVEGQGAGIVQYLESVSQPDTANFLAELGVRDPLSTHVVLYDGAGFHLKDGDVKLPANVRIVQFPAYSPELNPAEGFWHGLRGDLANVVCQTLEELREAVTASLSWTWTDPERVKGATGYGWLVNFANAT